MIARPGGRLYLLVQILILSPSGVWTGSKYVPVRNRTVAAVLPLPGKARGTAETAWADEVGRADWEGAGCCCTVTDGEPKLGLGTDDAAGGAGAAANTFAEASVAGCPGKQAAYALLDTLESEA